MVKELNFYQFNLLDSITERVNARLAILKNPNCEVYQNTKHAIIVCPAQNILGCEDVNYPEYKEVYLFSLYQEKLVEVSDNDYHLIEKTISAIMRGK